jgi:hypothetical protein
MRGACIGFNLDADLVENALEALGRDLEVIDVGDKVFDGIVAGCVAGDGNDGAFGLVLYRDRGARDGGSGLVRHGAENRSVDRLRGGRHGEQKTRAGKNASTRAVRELLFMRSPESGAVFCVNLWSYPLPGRLNPASRHARLSPPQWQIR